MKTINFRNNIDFEAIEAVGIKMTCNDDMNLVISDEDYNRLQAEFPAAFEDCYKVSSDETRTLYVLANNVWDANDYLNDKSTDPIRTDLYLFATREEAEKMAQQIDTDKDIYNDGIIYTGELTEDEIIEITGFDEISDFDDALAEPYSMNAGETNYGESEKTDVAKAIMEDPISEDIIECVNYDFDKSLEGAVLVFWSWQKHTGYARKCLDIRYADANDTEAILTKEDHVNATQCDILLTAEEVAEADDIHEAIREALDRSSWKWNNQSFIDHLVDEF